MPACCAQWNLQGHKQWGRVNEKPREQCIDGPWQCATLNRTTKSGSRRTCKMGRTGVQSCPEWTMQRKNWSQSPTSQMLNPFAALTKLRRSRIGVKLIKLMVRIKVCQWEPRCNSNGNQRNQIHFNSPNLSNKNWTWQNFNSDHEAHPEKRRIKNNTADDKNALWPTKSEWQFQNRLNHFDTPLPFISFDCVGSHQFVGKKEMFSASMGVATMNNLWLQSCLSCTLVYHFVVLHAACS